jgi:hypothetical protein
MNLEERQKALLQLVEDYREQECRRILEAARAEAAAVLDATWRRERGHLHARVVAERARAQARIRAAEAERATRERWVNDRTHTDLLAAAWPRLREALLERWRDPDGRERWVRSHLDQALAVLPKGGWMIRHAREWGEAERQTALERLTAALGRPPRFQTDGGIEAGLSVSSGGAVLDATLAGLLRDRPRLEARLLALMDRADEA